MSIDTAVARWRTRRATLATHAGSTVTVTRPGTAGTLNTTTGAYTAPGASEDVYDGPAIIRPAAQGVDQDSAGQEIVQGRWTVELHDSDATPAPGDQVHVDTSLQHPQLAGQTLTVRFVILDDWVVWPRVVASIDTAQTAAEETT